MDTATLVNERIDEGQQFVEHLRRNGFDVVVAFWVLTTAEERWFLYIATPVVDSEGPAAAYANVTGELSKSQLRWISRSDIRLIESHSPLALEAMAYQSNSLPTRYGGRKLGNLIIDDAYIYPK